MLIREHSVFSRSLESLVPPLPLSAYLDDTCTIPTAIYSLLQQPNGEEFADAAVVLSLFLAFQP